ncbi:helix-turn-helix transcriptional regulator [Nonomuraea turkmeniaca]|uniref:Helix-turn-helix transcriptional regulator n=1 Tax=Nonomuraea turkmeniaca TaxID=103838 RepID=A0A5S4FQK2_9ACTN|nr:helix-turn-helix transcriptional regulator [Nonomuraea turkmeniaca]TMR22972.1 helix-turn-helix transcriptional regulator [Nonomuraea turkmeniaca]
MYEERPPGPDLAGRVACVWHQVSETGTTHLVVPDACVDLIWGPEGLFVAGPDTGPMPTPMAAGDTFTGIRFKPGAVGDVFGVPVHELRDQRIPLPALPGLPIDESCAPRPEWRLEAMRAAVARRLTRSDAADPAAPAIAKALMAGRTVTEVAWDLGFSDRQLHRRAVAAFGYAPKTLQRIVRFQRALRLARAGVPLAEVAVTAGYTDQAHLSHDVKRLSGVPMGRLVSPVRKPA